MEGKKMDIFILAGQSNMSGRGGVVREADGRKFFQQDPSLAQAERHQEGKVWSFQGGIWQHAVEPIHAAVDNLKTCGYGPGPIFGRLLIERGLADSVGLVPCAVGGTGIDAWREGEQLFNQMAGSHRVSADSVLNYSLAVEMILQVNWTEEALIQAPQGSRLRGLLWYQGESDCDTEENAWAWGTKFEQLLAAFRERLNASSGDPLPTYMVVVSCQNAEVAQHVTLLQQVQASFEAPGLHKVEALGLELQEDGLHLTTAAQVVLGERLAAAYQADRQ